MEAFVLATFILGLGTKCYRDAHPSPPQLQSSPEKMRVRKDLGTELPGAPTTTPRERQLQKPMHPKFAHDLLQPVLCVAENHAGVVP